MRSKSYCHPDYYYLYAGLIWRNLKEQAQDKVKWRQLMYQRGMTITAVKQFKESHSCIA